ncbi:HEPN domain-containing protein [Lacibacter sp.]|uniref:HEPN domain-containing protein n=1 Tax=Lacibacter sp. TaxID=1915409 RepID=UPI002B4B1C12|nr:HEPN domain-containing protein [Lacibacter sp.]HLP36751.1 HEPN domain-containing protein [Lacibacter sp.]
MESLNTLLEHGNPALISRNLRKVLFDYLEDELKIGTTNYFLELLPELNYLFNFLEEAAEAKQNYAFTIIKKHAAVEDENCAAWLFEDDILYRVTVFLVITLQPERIYRIVHDPHLGQQPVTDLMIVLPDTMQEKPFSEYETLIEAGCSLGTQLSFSLQQASRVNTAVKEGHVFYSLVCTGENLMYWSEEKEWPTTPGERLKEIMQNARERFQTNFSKAQTFLHHATKCIEQQNNKLTAFFLQQAAELCCRAILISLTGRDKKTHSLAALKKTCRRCTAVVDQVFPCYTEEDKRLLKILDDAYIAARYEDDFSPSSTDIELLLQKVQQLHHAAVTAIKNRLSLPV